MTGFSKGPMGFHIDFENGWTVSVQFGIGNYCGNRDNKGNPFKDIPDFLECNTAEIAAWRTDSTGRGKGMSTKEWYTFEHGDQVDGWQTPAKVLEFINLIARKPNVGDEAGVIDVKASKILQDAYVNPPANNWDNLPGAYDPVEPQECGGEYISECCDATPIGELDSGSPLGGTEYYRVGFCSKCKDNAVFIKEELA